MLLFFYILYMYQLLMYICLLTYYSSKILRRNINIYYVYYPLDLFIKWPSLSYFSRFGILERAPMRRCLIK